MTLTEIRIVERAWHKAQMEYRRQQPDAAIGECWAELEALQVLLDTQPDDDRTRDWV